MLKKKTLTAVSYLNTKPLLYGILNHEVEQELEINLDIPSVCADKLKAGVVDFALVPVAVIPELENPHIISDYCIGSDGAVRTVCIFSDVPIHEIKTIQLDFHSRTSVQLCQILCREYWKITPEFVPASTDFINKISGTTAAVVIGDRTIPLEEKHRFRYDLGAAWTSHTGLPFVFAAWVSNQAMEEGFIQRFNAAMKKGVEMIPKLIYLIPKPHPNYDLQEYFQNYIHYNLDASKRAGLDLFLEKMKLNAEALMP